jgi:hypothetical protein
LEVGLNFPFKVMEAYVSVLLIRSQKLSPLASLWVLLTDLALEEDLGSFLAAASINPFICAEAKVSVYAKRAKKARDVFRGVLLDLFSSLILPFNLAEA